MPEALGVILARGGSKGIPRKNLVILCERPLLAYSVDAALRAKRLDRVVLSTDDDEIAKVGIKYGVEVIMRPSEYATDTAPMHMALRHAVRVIEKEGDKVDVVVALYANIPVRKEGIIDKVVDKLISSGADSVQTYTRYRTPPQWSYSIDGDKPIPLEGCYVASYRRQDLVPAYHPDGAVVAIHRDVLMKSEEDSLEPRGHLGTDRRAVIQAPEDTVDVDEPIDLLWAEFLLQRSKTALSLKGNSQNASISPQRHGGR